MVAMVVPQVYDSIITMWSAIPAKVREFLAWADVTFGEDERIDVILNTFNTSYEKIYTELGNWVTGTVVPQVTTVITGVSSSVFKVLKVVYNLLVGFIVSVYVLHSRKRFARQSTLLVRGLLPEAWSEAILKEVALIDEMFGGFIESKIVDSTIIGILCYIGCLILKMPSALIVSVVIGITNIIPFFGPFIGAIPATLLILIEDPIKGLWFVAFVIFLQQLDGNVIGPRIMGDRIGISGFWIMFSIILFGGLWGFVGMVIGVPMFAVIYDLVKKMVHRGLVKKGKIEVWEQYKADYPDEAVAPVLDPGDKITEWTREDWKRHMLAAWASVKTKWAGFCGWIKARWSFVKKWSLFIWSHLSKWMGIVWNFLKKWTLILCGAIKKCALKVWGFFKNLFGSAKKTVSKKK